MRVPLKRLLIAQAFPLGSAFLVCKNQTTHTSAYEALPAVWEKNIPVCTRERRNTHSRIPLPLPALPIFMKPLSRRGKSHQ